MANVIIFTDVLKKELQKAVAQSKEIEQLARNEAEEIFAQGEAEFFHEFDQHDVTRELEEGNNAENISGTLSAYKSHEGSSPNLFSFIGFKEGEEPIKQLRLLLEGKIKFLGSVRKRRINGGVEFLFNVDIPVVADLEEETPMPWVDGRSWVTGIERGISGLSAYLSGNYTNLSTEASRSRTGTMAKNPDGSVKSIRPGARFKNVRYLSDLLNKFKKNIK